MLVQNPTGQVEELKPSTPEPTPLQLALAPDIMAAILDDALPNHVTLFDLAVDPPALWDEQRERVRL